MTSKPLLGILATGPSLRKAPFTDDRFEWWGVAQLYNQVPKLHLAFEIHEDPTVNGGLSWAELGRIQIPIVMKKATREVPNAIPFPLEAAEKAFRPGCRAKLFTGNSVAYMLAMALLEPAPPLEIHLYGVDMLVGEEYEHQLRSVEHFLGIAIGKGIAVDFPPTSELLKVRHLYGLEDRQRVEVAGDIAERVAYYEIQRANAAADEDSARARRLQYEGLIGHEKLELKRAGM